MKSLLFIFLALFAANEQGQAQGSGVINGSSFDSTIITFSGPTQHQSAVIHYTLDTTGAKLWQIGSTSKSYFAAAGPVTGGIMTDTAVAYPINANDAFILKLDSIIANPIIDFTHRFETTIGKDGGFVEYSFDHGNSWNNVRGGCFANVFVDSFYRTTDTISGGIPAFSGISAGWMTSRLQFLSQGIPLKGAGCTVNWPLWIRFRFVSDSTAESLDGWLISSFKIELDHYGSGINDSHRRLSLDIHPNPSTDGYFVLPQLANQSQFMMRIVDAMGRTVENARYQNVLDLSSQKPGCYFYYVSGPDVAYSGSLLR